MVYGKVYIQDLSKKVKTLFKELSEDNRLGMKEFIVLFKEKYPRDYDLLVYEWEYKVHAFKKNRKGHPVPRPIRPDKILKNMYLNYYYKLVKKPKIRKEKEEYVQKMNCKIGKLHLRVIEENGRYSIIDSEKGDKVNENLTYGKLKKICDQLVETTKRGGAR